MFTYKAIVVSVYDGDTCRVDIDLGFGVCKRHEMIRLSDIDAPEVRGEEKIAGFASRDFLRELILGKEVVIETEKDSQEKYGRYLGRIFIQTPDAYLCVNDHLVKMGHAVYREY